MPLMKVQVSVDIPPDKKKALLSTLSKIISETLGKPEPYVMVSLDKGSIMISGKEGPAAFVDVRSIGKINKETNTQLAQKISNTLSASLGISPIRIFLNFTDIAASNWAWNAETFG